MKKILYIFILIGFLGVNSCKEKLELEPFDNLDVSVAFETNTDFENAINGVYSSLRDGNYYGGEFLLLPDVISDNLIICSEGRTSYSNYYLFSINGNIAWLNFWRAAYVTILRANHVLENIDNLPDGDFKNNIEGQALALRAMAHFDLARVYSKPPQFASSSDLGIAYVTSTDSGERPARVSVADTFAKIEADLNDAASLIGDDNGTGFFNKAAVHALRTRFYLYTGDNAKTITAADAAIAASVNGGVSSITEFPKIWKDVSEDGVIFKVINTALDNVGVGVVYNQKSDVDGIRSEYVPDYSFYTQYQPTDVRLNSYLETSVFAGNHTFNHVIKYLERTGSGQAVVDMKVLRWSEVYLSRAEAKAETGDDPGALADLDAVRSNRYTGFVSGGETGAALKAAIQLERRLELAFEGHRLFDLKRQGLDINRSNNGDYSDGTGVPPPAGALTLPASSPKFQMPIPQEELNANPNMQPNPSNG